MPPKDIDEIDKRELYVTIDGVEYRKLNVVEHSAIDCPDMIETSSVPIIQVIGIKKATKRECKRFVRLLNRITETNNHRKMHHKPMMRRG